MCPTDPFTFLEPPNMSIEISELHTLHRSADFEALRFWKNRSGSRQREWMGGKCDRQIPPIMGGGNWKLYYPASQPASFNTYTLVYKTDNGWIQKSLEKKGKEEKRIERHGQLRLTVLKYCLWKKMQENSVEVWSWGGAWSDSIFAFTASETRGGLVWKQFCRCFHRFLFFSPIHGFQSRSWTRQFGVSKVNAGISLVLRQ